jgi:hypothetical protein
VDDIAQKVWLKAFEKLHSYRGEAPFQHWAVLDVLRFSCAPASAFTPY